MGIWPRKATSRPRLTDYTDEQLLLGYRKHGRREWFAELVRRYERPLYAYLCRFLGDPDRAEDVFQATFFQVHLKADQFDPGRRFRPWLYAVATNQAIDFQRRNRRHRAASLDALEDRQSRSRDVAPLRDMIADEQPDPWQRVLQQDQAERLHVILQQLTPAMRAVVELVYFQGFSYQETADALGIPLGTVKSRMNAAVHRLGRLWQEREAAEPTSQ